MAQALLAVDMNGPDRAIELAGRATAMDPLNPWTFSVLCGVHLDTGHPAEAEAECRRAVEIAPSAAFVHSVLSIALLTNHKPRITGTDHGIWRRLRLVPFEVKYWDPNEPGNKDRPRQES